MPIVQTIKRIMPGMGSPTVYFANTNFNITNGNTVVSLPVGSNVQTNQVGIGPITCGIVRIKTEGVGTFINTGNTYPNASLFRILAISGDDASSNQVNIYEGDPATAGWFITANTNIDKLFYFNTDLPLANVNVVINVTNINSTGNAVFSVEVAGNP